MIPYRDSIPVTDRWTLNNSLIIETVTNYQLSVPRSSFLRSGSIYGFNVGASKSIQQLAARRGVPLRLHNIIYKLIDELKDELSGKLPPLVSENVLGEENTFGLNRSLYLQLKLHVDSTHLSPDRK